MAKSLVTGYRFDPTTDTVFLPDNIHAEKLLLITNVTANEPIYLFNSATLGYQSVTFNETTEETAVVLNKDCSGMSANDKLQIFVESYWQDFKPTKEFIDPVQKFRVSNPENLIDTDFEYGLQSTKWETLQTVNNVPTVYSASGDLPVEGVVSVESISGSKQIRVTTNVAHGLTLGDPISVQGLTLYQAEGYFTVSGAPDPLTFFYELDVPATVTADLAGGYTTIVPAKFYDGSALPIAIEDGAISDQGTPSNILVTTSETHGFSVGTKVYLRNTVGPKDLVITDPTVDAPDGRPYVDNIPSFTTTLNVDNSVSTGRGTFRETQTISHDWEPTYSAYFGAGDFDPATNQINWPNHGLHTRAALLFNTSIQGASNGGLTDGVVYYAKLVDSNFIQLSTNYETLADTVSLANIDASRGPVRLGLVYKIERNNGTLRSTSSSVRGQSSSNNNYFVSGHNLNTNINLTSISGAGQTISNLQILAAVGNAGFGNWQGGSGTVSFFVGSNGNANVNIANVGYSYNPWSGSSGGSTGLNYNATSLIWRSGSNDFITIRASSNTGSFWGTPYLNATLSWSNPTAAQQHSGADLRTAAFGLGQQQPTALVAFQGRLPNTNQVSTEDFSFLPNQRNNGRYSTLPVMYTNQVVQGTLTGDFEINYNDPNLENFASTSELYYIFARSLTADRNTVFIQNHGVESPIDATLTINATDFAAGQRFAFSDATGAITQINSDIVSVRLNPVSEDVIRIQLNVAPNTDNIVRFPQRYTLSYVTPNEFYNTIFVSNHKVIGSEDVVYTHSGYNIENFVEFDVTADGTTNYVFATTDTNMNGAVLPTGNDPTLTLYKGVTYHFDVNASGQPFYIKTTPTTGTSDQYTTGVVGNGTDVGVVLFTVPEDAPNTLYYISGNSSSMQGTINVQEMANNIGGLSFGQTYVASRVNDSRLALTRAVSNTGQATTTEVGAQNSNTQTFFIDIETPLGLIPSAASITGVQFRGNFSTTNRYVFMTLADGSTSFIGQRGADSAQWQTETTWATKEITSLLTTVGGKRGFNVTLDPTSQISRRVSGMTNWWEIRFIVSGASGAVNLTSTGTGEQKFSIDSLLGAYDGVYPIVATPTSNQFEIQTDFNIPARRYRFTSANVNNVNNSITFADPHNLLTGEKVTYESNGNPTIFTDAPDELFVIAVDDLTVKFASSYLSAISNDSVDISPQTGQHELRSTNVIKASEGGGIIDTTAGSNIVTGSGTRFLSRFKRFDKVWIEEGGILNEYTVDVITTDESMQLFENVATSQIDTAYYYATQVILRPDGFSLHKPFDGGVDITAGTSPNSKIVRQSRKYFRYQSGKGIQNSFAVNFNPPRLASSITGNSLGVATVVTQEVHNLNVDDIVIIKDCVVTVGENFYNGEFTVATVPDPFTFTYSMNGVPLQTKAAGFPSYFRKNWNDSYVRAGMFDDQNGFFFEYDGQKMYCVRRSSTAQIGGTVNVTRGSQVITGNRTAFSTQVGVGDKIVVRGQSYLIVEVSSDTRLVVQPSYRGVDARNVKATITVDTRVPQEEWSIDPCDGSGPTGFILNPNKIQMGYADYSWYGAGKIRFGWKDQHGEVKYVHEFTHNNRLDESYFRSGNLPGRYEIENGPNSNHAPTLFHFGTSIIMDGRFDNDKAYLFTANSKPFALTNGANFTFNTNATSTYQLVTLNGRRVWVYALPVALADAQKVSTGTLVRDPSNTRLPEGTYVTQVKLAGANSLVYTSWPATSTEPGPPTYTDIPSATTITAGEVAAVDLTRPIPLISIRLAPSVDSSLTGAIGEREIINRMQLQLRQAGVTANQDILVFLILNALPSSLHFDKVQQPSLSQLIEHNAGETLINGTTIYSLKASSGSTEIDLSELLEMGNSILGGDGIFPAGPDLLTVAVQPQNTAGISGTSPLFVSGKISWSESQA